MPESKAVGNRSAAGELYLYSDLLRLRILHCAAEAPCCGFGIGEELARRGYSINPRSLNAILRDLEKKGQLRSTQAESGVSLRRVYKATPLGRTALAAGKGKIQELFRELNAT